MSAPRKRDERVARPVRALERWLIEWLEEDRMRVEIARLRGWELQPDEAP